MGHQWVEVSWEGAGRSHFLPRAVRELLELEGENGGEQPLRGTSTSQMDVRLGGLVGSERGDVPALVALGGRQEGACYLGVSLPAFSCLASEYRR